MTDVPGHTEAQVLEAIERCVAMLAHQFVFGYFGREDMAQQLRMYAIEALPRYKPGLNADGVPSRPLANFLFSHCKNRAINLHRDKCRRTDPPCTPCHQGRVEHPDGEVCAKYRAWRKRNNAKANLVRPQGIDSVADERESSMRTSELVAEEADVKDMRLEIDEMLDLALRPDYLRMLAGEHVPKDRRQKVEVAILAIIRPHRDGGDS